MTDRTKTTNDEHGQAWTPTRTYPKPTVFQAEIDKAVARIVAEPTRGEPPAGRFQHSGHELP